MLTRLLKLPGRLYRLFYIRFILSDEMLEGMLRVLRNSTYESEGMKTASFYWQLAIERELLRREMKVL